jgi:AhpD family alkylhydroperoxidase
MTQGNFNRRIYTLPLFWQGINDIFDHLNDLRTAARSGRISHTFAEKIMLTVSQVNGCRYCLYGHSRAALACGVDQVELQKLLAGDIGDFPLEQAVALAFAQHYAESECQPDEAAWAKLVDTYGLESARDILAYLRMITFGNLLGNTFDALLSRLAFKPARGSSLLSELGVLLGALTIFPAGMFVRMLSGRLARPASTA